jgi:hypothetical protein
VTVTGPGGSGKTRLAAEVAGRVAGQAAGPAVLHLVDCSLLVPPRPGADGRYRYGMLETLHAYGARRLEEAGEQEQATAALAGYYPLVEQVATARWVHVMSRRRR